MNENNDITYPTLAALRERLSRNPGGVLESVAAETGVSTATVVECLPEAFRSEVEGWRFAEVMDGLAEWGEVLVIVHTPDAIIECAGSLPKGSFGRGFFNLGSGSPISGHIRAERCARIYFVERPFMGKSTCSVQFFNAQGETMFKVFVAREEDGELKQEQVRLFRELRERLAGEMVEV